MRLFSLPTIILAIFILVISFGGYIPNEIKAVFYSISLSIKESLLFVLPVIIFSFIFSSVASLQSNVFLFVIFLVLGVCGSNFLSTMIAYSTYTFGLSGLELATPEKCEACFPPLWQLGLPKWVSNDIMMGLGFLFGLIANISAHQGLIKTSYRLRDTANFILKKLFIPLVPLFILGFVLKLEAEGTLLIILKDYMPIFICLLILMAIYLTFLYLVASKFNFKTLKTYLNNVLPGAFVGFSSMSSAAALPLMIQSAEKNTKKPAIAQSIIPATVNIHLIGDSLAIPLMAIAIMVTHQHHLPDFHSYLIFAGYFVLAKFAVAAVPGGGILVMLPILKAHLGFTEEMLSLITALYILFDPIITGTNILGNGAFAIFFTRLIGRDKKVITAPAD